MKQIFKSAHNRRCTSSICIQTLCKVWIILIENCFELQITLSKYCLAGKHIQTNGRTDGRTEKAISRPASAFGDAGKNIICICLLARKAEEREMALTSGYTECCSTLSSSYTVTSRTGVSSSITRISVVYRQWWCVNGTTTVFSCVCIGIDIWCGATKISLPINSSYR